MDKRTIKDGMIIVLEGGEGSGKTTVAKLIERALSTSYEVVVSREPGGVELAEKIRNIILYNDMDKITELFLFEAARRLHWNAVIEPALKAGKIVILDRLITCTRVYQGMDNAIPLNMIDMCNDLAIDRLMMKNTLEFIMDLPVEIGLQRAGIEGHERNKNDVAPKEFHEKIRERYTSDAVVGSYITYKGEESVKNHIGCFRWLIDASQNIDGVFCDIMNVIQTKIDLL